MNPTSAVIDRVEHLRVAVSDLDAAVRGYTALFGWSPVWRGEHAHLRADAARFEFWNGAVELVSNASGRARGQGLRAHLEGAGPGPLSLGLGTTDAAAAMAALRDKGLPATPSESESGELEDAERRVRRDRAFTVDPQATGGLPLGIVEHREGPALAAPVPPPAGQLTAIDHIVVRTAEPEAAVALYGGVLGIRLALDRELAGTRMLFFRVGGVTLEIVEGGGDIDAVYGIAYRTADIDACHARISKAGFEVDAVRQGNKPGTRVFSVRGGTFGVPTLVLYDPARPAFGPSAR